MKKLLIATAAAVILAAPAFAQNQGPASTDPDPQVRNDLSRDPQQSGGGAVQSGTGGQANPKMNRQGQGPMIQGPGTTQGQGSGGPGSPALSGGDDSKNSADR